jgi:hypothetical protein
MPDDVQSIEGLRGARCPRAHIDLGACKRKLGMSAMCGEQSFAAFGNAPAKHYHWLSCRAFTDMVLFGDVRCDGGSNAD